jgi:DNA polymerase I-like protein with 3'-5' exonuclease and polymerase domains/uracil-DNA glycosylase
VRQPSCLERNYSPEAHGAECFRCPLRDQRIGLPVPPEPSRSPLAIIVGANPGPAEVEKGRPFVGPSGVELMQGLAAVGAVRSQFTITNSLLCCPPGAARGALERFLHDLQKTNKRRERQDRDRGREPSEPIPSPIECCRPRLLAEIAETPRVITLGGTALHSVLGRPTRVMDARGGPREVKLGNSPAPEIIARVLPTLHPSFILSSRRWRGPFRADLGRAVRWFTGGLAWQDPLRLEAPSPGQLAAFFLEVGSDSDTTCDLETFPGFPEVGHYDPLYDKIGLVGIGIADGRRTAIIPFRSIEGKSSCYTEQEKKQIVLILKDYFTSPRFVKIGHNFNYYDRMVIESRLGVTPAPVIDTIALAKLADPEMPHSLGFVGSIHTDVGSWKAGHLATDAKTDHEWVKYNSFDLAVTALAYPSLEHVVADRGQAHLLPIVHRLQDVCVGLHRTGLLVDEGKRREWDSKLLREAREGLSECRRLSCQSDLNPGSTAQLRNLLFDDLGIAPHHYSEKTGEASTDDDALRAFLSETWGLPNPQKKLVQAIRSFRKVVKLRGTYVTKLRPISDRSVAEPLLAWDEEETEEEREKRLSKHAASPGLVLPDGRVHPDYNAHGTLGWRLSSSNPNAQNFPSKLREIIVAGPGNVLVGCDEAQLELRMIAGLAKAAVYCEAFSKGEDPHRALCLDFFGEKFTGASKDQQKSLRVFVKQFTYASGYHAGPETVQAVLMSSEDEEGRLLYPDLTLRETSAFHDKWLRRNPEIEPWWESILEEWRRDHCLLEPILGLRVDFLDGEDPSKMINFKPQSGGSALVHLATFQALEQIPFEKWGRGTGIVTQTHDSLVVECPEPEGENVKRILEASMKMDGRRWGLDVPFLGEAKVGKTWKQV